MTTVYYTSVNEQ